LYHEGVQLLDRLLKYVHEHRLIVPGDRVGVAVSGGADSVALLRGLLELREELGAVLSVVHFNHQIRGAAADADQEFVAALARTHNLAINANSGDAPGRARASGMSLETAARDLRYAYFDRLLESDLSSIATGHTLDDQAETVLMRLVRGAGTRGLAGIYPVLKRRNGKIVRPLLNARRDEVVAFLKSLGQSWHDDASNLDLQHSRNRVRHKLIPLLEQEFNPAIVHVLGELAEIARGEEEFWSRYVQENSRAVLVNESLNSDVLLRQPSALQRRLLRVAAERAGVKLDFEHVEALRHIAGSPSSTSEAYEVPGATAIFTGRAPKRELRFQTGSPNKLKVSPKLEYRYQLRIPGEVQVAETSSVIRASLVSAGSKEVGKAVLSAAVPPRMQAGKAQNAGYNQPELLDPRALAPELTVRNWRPGDRYWPAHRKAPKKVKELLQHTTVGERATWPVVASGAQIVWMRGFPPAAGFLLKESSGGDGVLIEEVSQADAQ
jgi:tRNA(Ile)-lysidine synthase